MSRDLQPRTTQSDDVEQTLGSRFNRRNFIIYFGAPLAMAALAGCGTKTAGAEATPTKAPTAATAEAVPSAEPTETAPQEGYETYQDRYKDKLDQFLSVSANEFWSDTYTPEERLTMAMSFVGKMAYDSPYEVYTDAFGTYPDGKSVASYDPINTLTDKDADADSILKQNTYMETLVKAASIDPSNRNETTADHDLMAKLVALVAPEGDDVTELYLDGIPSKKEITKFSDKDLAESSAQDGSTSIDKNGRITKTLVESGKFENLPDNKTFNMEVTYTFYVLDDSTLGEGEGILPEGKGVYVITKIKA